MRPQPQNTLSYLTSPFSFWWYPLWWCYGHRRIGIMLAGAMIICLVSTTMKDITIILKLPWYHWLLHFISSFLWSRPRKNVSVHFWTLKIWCYFNEAVSFLSLSLDFWIRILESRQSVFLLACHAPITSTVTRFTRTFIDAFLTQVIPGLTFLPAKINKDQPVV